MKCRFDVLVDKWNLHMKQAWVLDHKIYEIKISKLSPETKLFASFEKGNLE